MRAGSFQTDTGKLLFLFNILLRSLFLLEEDGLDALDSQDDSQNHQQDAQDGLSPGTPVSAASSNGSNLRLGVDEQRGQGD